MYVFVRHLRLLAERQALGNDLVLPCCASPHGSEHQAHSNRTTAPARRCRYVRLHVCNAATSSCRCARSIAQHFVKVTVAELKGKGRARAQVASSSENQEQPKSCRCCAWVNRSSAWFVEYCTCKQRSRTSIFTELEIKGRTRAQIASSGTS
jgi:hypothetical protein